MTITVKFFAGLRETTGQNQLELPLGEMRNVRAVWACATEDAALPENTLCAVNLEHCEFDTPVRDGDEVAFFPPVTGG